LNNYWTLNFSTGFVLDDRTDLNLEYFFYRADDYRNNATVGVPYGAGGAEQAVTATLVRRIRSNIRLTLRYGYYHYTDDLSGGYDDFEGHLLLASVQYRF